MWGDFLHLSPSAAAEAMFAATGLPVTAREAKIGMRHARDARWRRDPSGLIFSTGANFLRSPLGARRPGPSGTTLLYRLIVGSPLREDQAVPVGA